MTKHVKAQILLRNEFLVDGFYSEIKIMLSL